MNPLFRLVSTRPAFSEAVRESPGDQTSVSPELALGYLIALGRMAVGATGLLFPRFLMVFWAGRDAKIRNSRASGLAVGARDLLVGLGTWRALGRNDLRSAWVRVGALSDTVDSVGTLLFFRGTPWSRRLFVFLTVGASAGAGWWLVLRHEDQDP
jgi:hypothetical protein